MFAVLSQIHRVAKLPALPIGHFLCLYDKAAQPRGIVVMAIPSPVKDFCNGKWAAVFYGLHKQKNFTQ